MNELKIKEGIIDQYLRPVKLGNENTSLEITKMGSGCKINGDLEVTGDITGNDVTIDLLNTNNIVSTGLTIDDSGDITLDAAGGCVDILQAELSIPSNKKVILGNTGEYIVGDGTDLDIVSTGGDINIGNGTIVYTAFYNGGMFIKAVDTNTIFLNSANSSVRLISLADTDDYVDIIGGANGALTINTHDHVGVEGDIVLSADGNIKLASVADEDITLDSGGGIILDSATGEFEMHGAGTVPKFADMYAGMILGYTRIQNDDTDVGDNIITVTTTMTVLKTVALTECKVTFVAPPSEKVEIQFSCQQISGRFAYYSLSSAASYAEVDEMHTYDNKGVIHDETDAGVTSMTFSITSGLTAGTSYTRWIAAKSNAAAFTIQHGRSAATGLHDPPIIIKAIALPATIVTGE